MERKSKMGKETIVETYGLCKKYKNCTALEGLNLQVRRGEIYGLIGDNGAGKTTFLKLLSGLIYPTGGEMKLFGSSEPQELVRARRRMGVLIEEPGFYRQLSVEKNLEYFRLQKGVPGREAVEDVLQVTGLAERRKKRGRQLSFGMKQRLGLGIALLGDPELLLLDEPINGLDPSGIIEMREVLRRLSREKGITIILSSHILSELEQLADVYGFLDGGVLLEQITREALQERCGSYIELRVSEPERYVALLEKQLSGQAYQVLPEHLIHILRPLRETGWYGKLAVESEIVVDRLEDAQISLEEYFVRLKGGKKSC